LTKEKQYKGALKLSRELRQLVASLHADLSWQTKRMIEAERQAIGEYAAVADDALAGDVFEATMAHARIWYESLLAGHPLTPEEMAPFAEIGRRRMRQGFHLPSLLHAIRLASIVLWNVLIEASRKNTEVRDELLFKVSPHLLQHFDLLSQAVASGYVEEDRQRARWHEQLKHELSSLLFTRPDDLPRFRELTRALDLDAAAPYAALAVRFADGQRRGEPERPAEMDALLEHAAAALEVPLPRIMNSFRHGLLLLWLPVSAADPMLQQEQQLAQRAGALLDKDLAVSAVGVGLPAAGPAGWRESADQALQALELGRSVGSADAVLRYTELALDGAVRGSPGLGRYLESLIERLAAEPALLETLDAFFHHRQHRKACAAALGIHINTLSYRLERIESLLGAQLDTPSWLARLHAALRLRRGQLRH
jgi:carbohydrate diacid regulator